MKKIILLLVLILLPVSKTKAAHDIVVNPENGKLQVKGWYQSDYPAEIETHFFLFINDELIMREVFSENKRVEISYSKFKKEGEYEVLIVEAVEEKKILNDCDVDREQAGECVVEYELVYVPVATSESVVYVENNMQNAITLPGTIATPNETPTPKPEETPKPTQNETQPNSEKAPEAEFVRAGVNYEVKTIVPLLLLVVAYSIKKTKEII